MALIFEDGTGRADAESFASVAQADAHHAAVGNAAWAALDTAAKEVNLRLATIYMQGHYSGLWKGDLVYSTQALAWPRAGVYREQFLLPSNQVPVEVVKACCELALKASAGPLVVDEAAQVKSTTVGPITKVYADGARQNKRYAAVDATLRPLLSGGGAGIRLVRA